MVLVQNGSAIVILDEVDNLAQHLVGMAAVVAHTGHPNRQGLPLIEVRCAKPGSAKNALAITKSMTTISFGCFRRILIVVGVSDFSCATVNRSLYGGAKPPDEHAPN